MRRREFIALMSGVLASCPNWARAQGATPTIGFLSARSSNESEHLVEAFRKGLAEGGLPDSRDVSIEYSWADNQYDRLPDLAASFVRRKVAALVAVGGDMTAQAAFAATKSVPIIAVFIGDPVANGYVSSLSNPGGNITGVSNLNAVIEAKRLGLLREMKPDMTFIGCLLNPDSPVVGAQQKDIEDASRQVGLHVGFWKASKDSELDAAFTSMRERRISALLVPADAYFASSRQKLADLTDRYAIPSMHSLREAAVAGGLMSYGVDLADTYRLIGVYAARVVKGALPSVLPVIQPTKFQFVLNLKTARLLGLSVPPGVLSIVDEVIE